MTKVWNDLGFWEHSCGCSQFQDGWERCSMHKEIAMKPDYDIDDADQDQDYWNDLDYSYDPLDGLLDYDGDSQTQLELDLEDEQEDADEAAMWDRLEQSELEYKDQVTEKLIAALDEYMEFSTARDLIRLLATVL